MAKKKKCCADGGGGDIPAWFMTYSDVITLLMTFFILLLTFSTNEPEFFSKVQVVAFGGGGLSGVAGEVDSAVDLDTPIVRYRPPAARISARGAEHAPTEIDPATESLSKGLQSLDETDELCEAERIRMKSPIGLLRDSEGRPTPEAIMQMEMVAEQLRNMPVELAFRTGNDQDAEFCIKLALAMTEHLEVPLGRISVGAADPGELKPGYLNMIITRTNMTELK